MKRNIAEHRLIRTYEITESRMKAAVHSAKALILSAGVSKLLDHQMYGNTEVDQPYIDTAIAALQEAKREMQRATAILSSIDFAPKSIRTLLKTASPKRRR